MLSGIISGALLAPLWLVVPLLPLLLNLAAQASASSAQEIAKPKVPLSSTGRWIVDTDKARVKLRCINWAAHLQANIPEGLHRQSVENVAAWIANEGFNCVRLTFSIDLATNFSLGVRDSFKAAAAATEVPEDDLISLYDGAVERNPFLENATLIDVFDRTVTALWDRGVMTMLDNHVSRARWCCDLDDGNGWWADAPFYSADNSRYFDSTSWLVGLQAMARWAGHHPGVVGMGLRNEMRATTTQVAFASGTWYQKMDEAARIVHAANPDMLVVVGGLNGGTDLMPLRARPMDTSAWAGKNVWEAHVYSFTPTTPNFGICSLLQAEMGLLFGFVLGQDKAYTGPLFLSEFGVGMADGPIDGLNDEADAYYLKCLVSWLESNDADWALWAIQGSYYLRDGKIDHDEDWGALNHNWTEWRNPMFKGMLGAMFNVTRWP